jgi:hypothetical protein
LQGSSTDDSSGSIPGSTPYGGAVYNAGVFSATNNTFYANRALGGVFGNGMPWTFPSNYYGLNAYGGAFYNATGTVTLAHNTFAANEARGGVGYPDGFGFGGAISVAGGTVTVINSILTSSPAGSNAAGVLIVGGGNISSDASCGFSTAGSLNNTDSKLGPFGNYGGPTWTMPLLVGSPALNTAISAACPPTDQRGVTKPFGGACDIGAFESAPPYTIRGRISGFNVGADIGVTAGATSAVTDAQGDYELHGLPAGSYIVEPIDPNTVLSPESRAVNTGPDAVSIDFKAYRVNHLAIEPVTNGLMRLVFAGTNGQSFRAEISTNLTQWTDFSTGIIGANRLSEIYDTNGPPWPSHFFRIQSP